MMFTKRRVRVQFNEADLPGEGFDVVKGTSRRVVVVRSPDKRIFEEAIFIVREDYMRTAGITRAELMKEAESAAGSYVSSLRPRLKPETELYITAAISALGGSGITVLILKLFGM